MTETCEVAINLELLKAIGIMWVTIGAASIVALIAVAAKRLFIDLARYMDGGEQDGN